MPNPLEIQVAELAADIKRQFESPKIYAGCEVKSVADISLYTSENGWIEALVHEHNQQRIRYRGTPAGVGTADLIDVIYYPNTNQFVSYSAGGTVNNPADNAKVSKLVSPDLSIDPVIAADNNGDVTSENDLILGNTARGNIFASWFDFNHISANIPGSHYNDNDSSFPAEFSEIDTPQDTDTTNIYGFWYIKNNSGTGSYKYRFQTSTAPEGASADLTIGPILFRDGQFSADVDYYFGLYRDNSGIDEGTFNRVHLQWDSATPQWRIRGEVDDGTTQTDSAWTNFSLPIVQPIWARIRLVEVGANITTRSYFGITRFGRSHTLFQSKDIAKASVTWGDVWIQYHQTRAAGPEDYLYIGGHDSEIAP